MQARMYTYSWILAWTLALLLTVQFTRIQTVAQLAGAVMQSTWTSASQVVVHYNTTSPCWDAWLTIAAAGWQRQCACSTLEMICIFMVLVLKWLPHIVYCYPTGTLLPCYSYYWYRCKALNSFKSYSDSMSSWCRNDAIVPMSSLTKQCT